MRGTPSLTITEQGVYEASVRLNPELHECCNYFMGWLRRSYLICKRISSHQLKLYVGYLECWVHRLSAEGMIREGSPKQPQLAPRHCTDLWLNQKKTPNLAWLNRSVVRFVWGIHSRSGLKLRQKAMGGPTTNSPPQSITYQIPCV